MNQPEITCPNCGQPLPPRSQFCGSCGTPITIAQPSRTKKASSLWGILGVILVAAVGIGLFFLRPQTVVAPTPAPTLSAEEQIDREGGIELLYEVSPGQDEVSDDQLLRIVQVMNARLDFVGVSTHTVQVSQDRRIQVQLLGGSNTEELEDMLSDIGLVEFVDTGDAMIHPGTPIYTDLDGPPYVTPGPNDTIYHTVMTGSSVASATVSVDNLGRYQVEITFNEAGANLIADFTKNHIDKTLSISIDRLCLMSPRIVSEIADGQAILQGNLTLAEATRIAAVLTSGSLPFELRLLETRAIAPR